MIIVTATIIILIMHLNNLHWDPTLKLSNDSILYYLHSADLSKSFSQLIVS